MLNADTLLSSLPDPKTHILVPPIESKPWFKLSLCLCGVRPARRRLRARLVSQWKAKQPTVREVDTNFTGVNFLSADNQVLRRSPLIETTNKCLCQVVVCGYTRDAIARVFSISDGALLHLLKCVPEGTRLGFGGGQVPTLVTCTFSYFILPFYSFAENALLSPNVQFCWIQVQFLNPGSASWLPQWQPRLVKFHQINI